MFARFIIYHNASDKRPFL